MPKKFLTLAALAHVVGAAVMFLYGQAIIIPAAVGMLVVMVACWALFRKARKTATPVQKSIISSKGSLISSIYYTGAAAYTLNMWLANGTAFWAVIMVMWCAMALIYAFLAIQSVRMTNEYIRDIAEDEALRAELQAREDETPVNVDIDDL